MSAIKMGIMEIELTHALKELRKQLDAEKTWLLSFSKVINRINFLSSNWIESDFVHKIHPELPVITKVSGVDGGVISEALAGLDLIIYRAVGVTFVGIGKDVYANYTPNFDPEPSTYIGPSLATRQEFVRLTTLYRLLVEYDIAIKTIEEQDPSVVILDGKVAPLTTDFMDINSQSKVVSLVEKQVKDKYQTLIQTACNNNVILCGLVKDSRSRNLSSAIYDNLPDWIQEKKINSKDVKGWGKKLKEILDHSLCASILQEGERTAWLKGKKPNWITSEIPFEILETMVRPISQDVPIKFEVISFLRLKQNLEIALSSLYILCKHGLPIAIPTIILEADERTKLSSHYLDNILQIISTSFGISIDELRKRRNFRID